MLANFSLSVYLSISSHICTSWLHFSHPWRAPRSGQKQVRNVKRGRPPNPAAHMTSEAAESYSSWCCKWHMITPSQLWTRSTDRKCTSNRPTRSIKPRDTWCIQEPLSRNETHFTDSNLIFISTYWITAPLCSAPNCGKRSVISCTVLVDHFALGDSWQAESAGVGGGDADLILRMSFNCECRPEPDYRWYVACRWAIRKLIADSDLIYWRLCSQGAT